MGLPPELEFVFGDISNVFERTKLIAREMVAENTLALTLERPANFFFEAGQNTMIFIPGSEAEDSKEFTFASAPYEKDLVLAMRVRNSRFKHACYALKPGDMVMMRSASGGLWSETDGPQVWLSGGIGITPFRSVIRQLIHQNAPLSITHIHSDRSRSSVPFLTEFETYAAENPNFKFATTLTRERGQGSLVGRITGSLIEEQVPQYAERSFFVCGTDAFVGSMRDTLAGLGIASEKIRTERFDGYKVHNT